MAEVSSLQSQLHSVNGRSASGDRTILPRSSVSNVIVIKRSYFQQNKSECSFPPRRLDRREKRNFDPRPPVHL